MPSENRLCMSEHMNLSVSACICVCKLWNDRIPHPGQWVQNMHGQDNMSNNP